MTPLDRLDRRRGRVGAAHRRRHRADPQPPAARALRAALAADRARAARLSAWRGGLNTIAGWVGVTAYPPAVLFAVALLFVLVVLLHYSTVISKLVRPEHDPRAAGGAAGGGASGPSPRLPVGAEAPESQGVVNRLGYRIERRYPADFSARDDRGHRAVRPVHEDELRGDRRALPGDEARRTQRDPGRDRRVRSLARRQHARLRL